ncbi:MAG: hypothetical protein Fur0032_00360 [Terrimicrobiaceae bacterium]
MVLPFRKSICFAVLAGGLFTGFLLAFHRFFAPPPPSWILLAGQGAIDPQAGWLSRVFHGVWQLGGETGLGWLCWLVVFALGTAKAILVLALAAWLAGRLGRRGWLVWLVAELGLAGWAVPLVVFSSIRWSEDRLRPDWPWDLLREVSGSKAYLSPTAALLSGLEGEKADLEVSSRLARDPVEWRREARRSGWSAVVLAGSPAEYRQLLDHLVESPDWRLAAIRPGGFLYLRDGQLSCALPDIDGFDAGSRRATARSLARLSEKFEAIRNVGAARKAILRALELAPKDIEVLIHAAHFAAARERWHDVEEYAGDALGVRPGDPHASYLMALAALESGDLTLARDAVDRAASRSRDRSVLMLKARICRAQRDFLSEAETLRGLVAMYPAGSVARVEALVFLGQAWASAGQAPLALEAYREALDSDGLPPEQRADVEESVQVILKNSGLQ